MDAIFEFFFFLCLIFNVVWCAGSGVCEMEEEALVAALHEHVVQFLEDVLLELKVSHSMMKLGELSTCRATVKFESELLQSIGFHQREQSNDIGLSTGSKVRLRTRTTQKEGCNSDLVEKEAGKAKVSHAKEGCSGTVKVVCGSEAGRKGGGGAGNAEKARKLGRRAVAKSHNTLDRILKTAKSWKKTKTKKTDLEAFQLRYERGSIVWSRDGTRDRDRFPLTFGRSVDGAWAKVELHASNTVLYPTDVRMYKKKEFCALQQMDKKKNRIMSLVGLEASLVHKAIIKTELYECKSTVLKIVGTALTCADGKRNEVQVRDFFRGIEHKDHTGKAVLIPGCAVLFAVHTHRSNDGVDEQSSEAYSDRFERSDGERNKQPHCKRVAAVLSVATHLRHVSDLGKLTVKRQNFCSSLSI
jgi:hypothetical protein